MTSRIRVFYLIERLARAGTELHLLKLIERLDRERFEPHLCCLSRASTDESLLPRGVSATLLDAGWNLLRPGSLRVYHDLRRTIRAARPDVLHSFLFVSNVVGPFAARAEKVPTVLASRGRMGIEWEAGPLHRLAQRAADRRCDALLCKTQAMAEEIHAVEGAARERIYVVPNGVDLEAYRLEDGASAAIRETLERDAGIPREAPFAVAVGNLKPIKGHETLVRALPAALERFPALHVALVGEGESEAALRRLADDLRVTKNLHLPGRIEDVRPWMRGADLFVAPSRSEGLPNAVLEAMALGTPALLSDIPGHREAAGETAWYFEVDDVRGLSAAMIEAFGQPARRTERAREGCERIRREFSVERMVRRIESIYEALSVRGD